MKAPYDIVIVGAGLFGATCAYELNQRGFRCLVLDKRNHIAGNCYTEKKDEINVHKYGPHIFHTRNKAIWDWVNRFARFINYRHRPKVNYQGKIYSFPVNLLTLHQLWGVSTPEEAKERLNRVRVRTGNPDSAETWLLSQVGSEIYEAFFKGYTEKQWGRPAKDLPASIVKRVPLRLTFDDSYFDDQYQGIPIGGYTAMFSKMLENVEVRLNTDYFQARKGFDNMARRVLYTGPIDSFFEHRFGRLEYRSIRFENERLETSDFQGVSMMHYTSPNVPFTRIVEHKHFEFGRQPVTWITREYAVAAGTRDHEPMYPIRDQRNSEMFRQYELLSHLPEWRRYYFGGRMAEYQYYDMHQVIGSALATVKVIERDLATPSPANRKAFSTNAPVADRVSAFIPSVAGSIGRMEEISNPDAQVEISTV